MTAMHRLRLFHAVLALGVVLAFLSPDWGPVHLWLGYGVAVMILLRLVMAFTGAPQLGLMRFYPHVHGLKLGTVFTHPAISGALLMGIAICLIGVTGTGIALDRGRTFGLDRPASRQQALSAEQKAPVVRSGADEEDGEHRRRGDHDRGEDEGEDAIEEVHELLGNLLMFLVGGHVAYLLIFKRPLARFMLFLTPARHPARPLEPKAGE
ncbi:MAG: cytochrome b/b6 domain-containing protein [Caulobacter sp.]|nr:cytochrome b/b6 domain-containing protein [Caulobacter sp.]